MAAFLCIDTVKNLLIQQICLKVKHVMHVDTFDEKSHILRELLPHMA